MAFRNAVAIVARLHRILLTARAYQRCVGDDGRRRLEGRCWDRSIVVGAALLLDLRPLVREGRVVGGVFGALQADEEVGCAVGADDVLGQRRAVGVRISAEASQEIWGLSEVGC